MDLEFLVQYLQLCHAARLPDVLKTNTWDALAALHKADVLETKVYRDLRDAYDNLRTIESRLRIAHNRSGVELPEDEAELARLARRLNYPGDDATSAARFRADVGRYSGRVRELFEQVVAPPRRRDMSERGKDRTARRIVGLAVRLALTVGLLALAVRSNRAQIARGLSGGSPISPTSASALLLYLGGLLLGYVRWLTLVRAAGMPFRFVRRPAARVHRRPVQFRDPRARSPASSSGPPSSAGSARKRRPRRSPRRSST